MTFRFMIDSNRINANQGEKFMNRLEEWEGMGLIEVLMSETAFNEVRVGPGNRKRLAKAATRIFTIPTPKTDHESKMHSRIGEIIFPGGAKNENQNRDVEIVFEAWKYKAILITSDGGSNRQQGGMLGNAERLHKDIGVKVITDQEAVSLVDAVLGKNARE